MQMELLSAAVYMRADYLCDSCVDTIVPVAFLIFVPIGNQPERLPFVTYSFSHYITFFMYSASSCSTL